MADVKLALTNDLKMGGNASFFVMTESNARWPEEEKLTIIEIDFSGEYRQPFGQR